MLLGVLLCLRMASSFVFERSRNGDCLLLRARRGDSVLGDKRFGAESTRLSSVNLKI